MTIVSLIYTFLLSMYLFFYNENILQKQYYEIKRFFKSKKQNFKINYFKIILVILSIILVFLNIKTTWLNHLIIFLTFIFSFFIYHRKIDNKIIKFKITKRVVRALVCYFISYGLYILLVILLKIPFSYILLLYYFVFFVFFLISYFLSLVIENIILLHYQILAKKKLEKFKHLIVIGISGSYGKTSLKHYLKNLLETKYCVLASQKSYNTMKGLLMCINNDLKPYHEILILEMGVDKIKGMDKFIKFFKLDIGILTCIGMQHLSTFKSFKNIISEKAKLLQSLKTNKLAIINKDDENIYELSKKLKCKKIFVSSYSFADIYATNIKIRANCTFFTLHINNEEIPIQTKVLGRHHVNNLLLAIAVAKHLNIKEEQIIRHLRLLKNIENRMEYKKDHNWDIIDDSYNSNYEGFLQALSVLKKAKNKKVLLTPGLIELAKENENYNKNLALKIKESANLVLITNLNGQSIYQELLKQKFAEESLFLFESYVEAIKYLKEHYFDESLTILIENDLPDIYLK